MLNVLKYLCIGLCFMCADQETDVAVAEKREPMVNRNTLNYLALGDSYTIGESVAIKDRFPIQLEKLLQTTLQTKIKTKIVAKTGWRTDNLMDALNNEPLDPPYDLVTLLIGVNNQYQDMPFANYEKDFPELLARAITLAENDPKKVIVVSIPDWGFTPFGRDRDTQKITAEIDRYNAFAKMAATKANTNFVDITDITREGLDRPELVANDGLHPSALAYALFAGRIAPIISSRLKD